MEHIKKLVKFIKCSQCESTFSTGYDYRLHWEKRHFYPYLKTNSFDFNQSIWDSRKNNDIDRLIKEISERI
jgi:hypothetical protein